MIKAVIFDMYETLITHFHFQTSVYFGKEIAEDAGITEDRFLPRWRETERDRSLGRRTNESVIREIMLTEGVYDRQKLQVIMEKMRCSKTECFLHLHEEILPMLEELKKRGIQIALITNCYSIEAEVIRESVLFPYFDAVCFSCEEGVVKPDPMIFSRCLDRLGVQPSECIYVGDGGSRELEAALEMGMKPLQAAWYLFSEQWQPAGRKEGFVQLDRPMDLFSVLDEEKGTEKPGKKRKILIVGILGVLLLFLSVGGVIRRIEQEPAREETIVLYNRSNAKKIWKYLRKDLDCSRAAAAGILGNMYAESGIDPESIEPNGVGHGICQWSWERWYGEDGLEAYAGQQGMDWTDLKLQLSFLKHEVVENDSMNAYYEGGFSRYRKLSEVDGEEGSAQVFFYSFEYGDYVSYDTFVSEEFENKYATRSRRLEAAKSFFHDKRRYP